MIINVNTDSVLDQVKSNGFSVQQDAIDLDTYNPIQKFWMDECDNIKSTKTKYIRGMFDIIGEANLSGYSNIHDEFFFRYTEYLWNKPKSEDTRELIYAVHKIRNKLLNNDEYDGIAFSQKNNALSLACNIYPNINGCLSEHRDVPDKDKLVLHSYVPITFGGEHFEEGGLYVKDNNDKIHNLDLIAKPGSVVYFNGAFRHGVTKTKSKKNIDRIALYPMHSYFFNSANVSYFLKNLIKLESKIRRKLLGQKFGQGLVSKDLDN